MAFIIWKISENQVDYIASVYCLNKTKNQQKHVYSNIIKATIVLWLPFQNTIENNERNRARESEREREREREKD